MDDYEKGYPVTPCMDVYKANIQSDEFIEKLNMRIVFKGDLQNKDMNGGRVPRNCVTKTDIFGGLYIFFF